MLRLHPYRYHRPRELAGALELLKVHAGNVMPIAGGTDLMPNMKHRLFTPGHLVSLKGVEGLYGIEERDGEIWIGACESLTSVASAPLVKRYYPSLAFAASTIANPMIRNQGTIGGNLCLDTRCTYYNQTHFWRQALGFCLKRDGDVCHVVKGGTRCVAAHSADTPPVLITLGASADLASTEGTRTIGVEEFFTADGVWNTARKPHEVVTRVRLPKPPAGLRTSYQKLRERKSVDFPILSVALAVAMADTDTVASISLVVSGLGAKPRTIGQLDDIAAGRQLDAGIIEAVAEQAYRQCHPLANIIVDSDWRRAMVRVYVRRAFRDIQSKSEAAA
ncbi:MAG: FAD binding domain-containing protein [Gemmatimonadota bacterium]|nr:MAG: FAD binding domain-containing protein [Gemmatimonadota bacterium]